MTKDDICKWIHMAWDFTSEDNLKRKFEYQEAHYIPYEKFAKLVAEHERESRQWVGLTDEETKEIIGPWGETPIKGYTRKLFDQIEAKLKEKNT